MTTQQFIAQHANDDPRQLALQAQRYPDVDMPYALNQIQGRQAARRKLPQWAATDGMVYPPHLSMEQCSSEPAAIYKAGVAQAWIRHLQHADDSPATSLTDLTGGFGVDFSYVARCFDSATYVERSAELCKIASSNMPLLGLTHAHVECADAEQYIDTMREQTMIFVDPARRDNHGGKTVLIADCTPDVATLLPKLMAHAKVLMIKLSPMLDWHHAVASLQGMVRQVHIVSVGGECKELLLVLAQPQAAADADGVQVVCADVAARADDQGNYATTTFCYRHQPDAIAAAPPIAIDDLSGYAYIYEPNASIMKAGCFGELAHAYGVSAVSHNSHLFVSQQEVKHFPGRAFSISTVTTLNRKQLRTAMAGISKANVAVRNFPLSAVELRKRLKLADGGTHYIFGTTTNNGEHVLIVGQKA